MTNSARPDGHVPAGSPAGDQRDHGAAFYPPDILSNHTTTFTFDDGADPTTWFSGTYAIVLQAEGGYGMAIALDDAPVTLNRPLRDGETLAVTVRRGVGRAGVRLVSETTAYTVWIETSGIAVLERDGAEQGRVPVSGDAQRVTLTYTAGTLTASVGETARRVRRAGRQRPGFDVRRRHRPAATGTGGACRRANTDRNTSNGT
jgi:hypothetical protein